MHRFMLDTSAIIVLREEPELLDALRELEDVEFFTTHVQDDEDHGEPLPGLVLRQVATAHFALNVSCLDHAALGEPEELEPFIGEEWASTVRDALITATAIGEGTIVVFEDWPAVDRMSKTANLRHVWPVARLRDWAFRRTGRR